MAPVKQLEPKPKTHKQPAKKEVPAKNEPPKPQPLEPNVVPVLLDSETTPKDITLYLQIDLSMPGATAETVVYAPDRSLIKPPYNIILYFHGNKKTSGLTLKEYLKDPDTALRDFILKATNRGFLLVMPDLGDWSSVGALDKKSTIFLQQVVNGVHKHLLGKDDQAPSYDAAINKIALAAHSGGYKPLNAVGKVQALNDKIRDVWCLDCTYGGGQQWVNWAASAGHTTDRVFVYSTGALWDKRPKNRKLPAGPDNPLIPVDVGTDINAGILLTAAKADPARKNIVVWIKDSGRHTDNWKWDKAQSHYQTIGMYFPLLIDSSFALKP